MIDIHCHLIFGVDDGCQTIEDSLNQIKKAISVGVTDIILTSHYAPLRGYMVQHEEINEKFKELKTLTKKLKLPVNLYLGREIDKTDNINELLKNNEVQTMNGTNYVLVDFGMDKYDIDEYCYELVINGYKPIIAHPERYNYIDDPKLYKKWKKTGALIQINAVSLFHSKSKTIKKRAKYMLKEGLVDFIASDAHSNPNSYEHLEKAFELLKTKTYKHVEIKNEILIKEGVSNNE